MGQKVNPIIFRLGVNKSCSSTWYTKKNYGQFLKEDFLLREFLKKNYGHIGISKIEIERSGENIKLTMIVMRPGIIIGKKGEEAAKLKKQLEKLVKKSVVLNIKEVKKAEGDAQSIANSIAQQIERRLAFRRVIKKAVQGAMRLNVQGCKVMIAGRLNGAEIARTEWVREGRIPLHTLRIDLDYAHAEAMTTYGIIGIKVWVCKNEIVGKKQKAERN